MGSTRFLVITLCLLAVVSLAFSKMRANFLVQPSSTAQMIADRESQLSAQLKERGEEVLARILGKPAHLSVTVRCGAGTRKQVMRLFPGPGNRFGYSVTGLQESSEKFGKSDHESGVQIDGEEDSVATAKSSDDQKPGYKRECRSEKREYSSLQQEAQETLWIERITVCAIVPPTGGRASEPANLNLQCALSAALGLDSLRGDFVQVFVGP